MLDELFNHLTRAAPANVRADARAFLSRLSPVPDGEPQQLHLALGATDNELTLTWLTSAPCANSTVHAFNRSWRARTTTYDVPPRWWQPTARPSIHSATIRGVGPREAFEYTVGSASAGCSSLPPVVARAPPARGALPVRVALLADVGSIEILGFKTWSTLAGAIDTLDAAVHAGDVSYAGMDTAIPFLNVTKDDEFEPLWDVYGRTHANFTSQRTYQVGIGNHEAWYNYTSVRHRYPMAHQGAAAAHPPFWFWFALGGVHFTMLSSEHDYSAGSAQRAFAEAAE